ncbi:hypothetical protein BVY03_00440 [bacterium K02(2017)]|nr:hypothetical protein BVY03_00440 [bacterium K02(2017)]
MLETLITTIIKRPYVLMFLISYVFIAIRVTNIKWTSLYLVAGYSIAFLSEFTSINYGYPYGWYFYKYENLMGEWLNNGVPVWDSVSYVFMCFSGLYTARYILGSQQNKLKLILLSAVLVTILDIIIDPVSHMGKRWFLGEIYYYPQPGFYFDITFANFCGWFLVSFLINSTGVYLLKFDQLCKSTPLNNFLGIGLYFGIFGFGLIIAIYLQEIYLVLCDLGWLYLVLVIMLTNKSWGVIPQPFITHSEQN